MARPKLGDSETERLHIKITADEIQAIEDWRYANRVPSKSEAVRRLVQIGLIADGTAPELLRLIRSVSDTEVIALMEMARPDIAQEEREQIWKEMDNYPDRARMIIGALSLLRAIEAFRQGTTFDEAVAIRQHTQMDLNLELEHALGRKITYNERN